MSQVAGEFDSHSAHNVRRWRRVALWVSVAFHLVLLSVLAAWYVGKRQADQQAKIASAAAEAAREAQPRPKLPSPEVRTEQVQATLAKAREKYAAASTAEQLTELDKQAAKLESLSSEESVAEIADKFREWTPTPERASQPAADEVAGQFDFDTAQIHDVLRIEAADGQWDYRTVLIDAQGRSFEVEIDRVQGEKTFATFESLKKFPLANQVYRQIAMGLIDRALQGQRSAAGAPPSEPSVENAEVVDDRDPFDDSDSTPARGE